VFPVKTDPVEVELGEIVDDPVSPEGPAFVEPNEEHATFEVLYRYVILVEPLFGSTDELRVALFAPILVADCAVILGAVTVQLSAVKTCWAKVVKLTRS
jgi:hypothetical protein